MWLWHAAGQPRLNDRVLLSVGGNMGEVLGMEKGRSPDPILNCQCRRACGLQLASGIRWRRRHLETTRNPTDRGSRLALSGALAPGETVSRSEGQRRSRFLSARAGAARSCGLTHAEFATAISAPVPKASLPVPLSLHSGTRFEPGSVAATADARLRDLASFATPVSELPWALPPPFL